MESVELALKNTNRNNEKFLTDDDFSVDDLLDFSNDDVFVDDEPELTNPQQRKRGVSDDNTLHRNNELLLSTACQDFGPLPTSDISLPTDDVAELEWLSNFVEDDSITPYSALTKKPVCLTGERIPPVNKDSCFKAPLPVKFRTKRARTGVSVWSLGLPPDTSSCSSSSSTSGPPSPLWPSGDEKAVKRQKKPKRKALSSLEVLENGVQTQTQTRRCTHCGVQKTPQWRAGPVGPKTLCNACGVRFKSGRLLPEYRPACSPTFSSELHSNHHRKVIEMRRKKETSSDADDLGLNQPVQVVQSF